MKTLARLRQVRKRGGCQAAKTEVSCVNHEKGRERTIRIEKREGEESHFWSSRERHSWNLASYRDAREIIARFRSELSSIRLFLSCPSEWTVQWYIVWNSLLVRITNVCLFIRFLFPLFVRFLVLRRFSNIRWAYRECIRILFFRKISSDPKNSKFEWIIFGIILFR